MRPSGTKTIENDVNSTLKMAFRMRVSQSMYWDAGMENEMKEATRSGQHVRLGPVDFRMGRRGSSLYIKQKLCVCLSVCVTA